MEQDRSECKQIYVCLAGQPNYHLANLLDTIDSLYAKYNAFCLRMGMGPKYDIGECPYVRDRGNGQSQEDHPGE